MKFLLQNKVWILLIVGVTLFSGCRKGEEDPFISFQSRKARLSGDWTVDAMNRNVTDFHAISSTESVPLITAMSIVGNQLEIREESYNSTLEVIETENFSGTVSEFTYSFDKSGSFKMVLAYEYPIDDNGTERQYTYREEREGSWYFLDGTAAFKNKQRIALNTENKTTTIQISGAEPFTDAIASTQDVEVWELIGLSSEEVKAHADLDRNEPLGGGTGTMDIVLK